MKRMSSLGTVSAHSEIVVARMPMAKDIVVRRAASGAHAGPAVGGGAGDRLHDARTTGGRERI